MKTAKTPKAPKTVLACLKAARKLITNPKNWCQKDYAKTKDGLGTHGSDPKAVKFCALGALARVYQGCPPRLQTATEEALYNASLDIFNTRNGIAAVNDHIGHKSVLKVFDYTIKKFQKRKKPVLSTR